MVDAFSGIGGFHYGAKLAASKVGFEIECSMAIEKDFDAATNYELNHLIKPFGDINDLTPSSVPDHDLLTGGFPCQPFSRNGKYYNKNNRTLGENEERGNLFLRLADILLAKKPKFFIFENVNGLLSMKNYDGSKAFDAIVHILTECGYSISWQILDSKDFGVPQQRKRVYIVGIRSDLNFTYRFVSPNIRTVPLLDITELSVDSYFLLENRWKNLKNHRIPGTRFEALKAAYESGKWAKPLSFVNEVYPVAIIYGDTPSGGPRQQDKLYSYMGISPTIATFELTAPAFDFNSGWRKLTPRECYRLQGFSDSHKIPKSHIIAYRQAGNAVTVNVVAWVIENLLIQAKNNAYV